MPKFTLVRTVEFVSYIEADTLDQAIEMMEQMKTSTFDEEFITKEEIFDENQRWVVYDIADEENENA